jgi:hypothetical protein
MSNITITNSEGLPASINDLIHYLTVMQDMFVRTTYPIHRYPYIYFPLPHSQCISGMTVVFFVP